MKRPIVTFLLCASMGVTQSFAANHEILWLPQEISPLGDTSSQTETMPKFYQEMLAVEKVTSNGTFCGYLNVEGEFVISPSFLDAQPFSENMAAVKEMVLRKDVEERLGLEQHSMSETTGLLPPDDRPTLVERYGYIDTTGEMVILPTYETAKPFSEHFAAVELVEGKWGYINSFGELVFGGEFTEAGNFRNGVAVVKEGEFYGLLNTKGEFILPPLYEKIEEGEGLYPVLVEGRYGLLDVEGNFLCEPTFDTLQSVQEELFLMEMNGKWGYLDELGQVAVSPTVDAASSMEDGFAWMLQGETYGIWDSSGNCVLTLDDMEEVTTFSSGYGRGKQGDFYGFFDRTGEIVIPFVYENAIPVSEGVGMVYNGQQWGFFTPLFRGSDWSRDYVSQSEELNLIPSYFQGIDLSQPVTRVEFVSLVVTLYELLLAEETFFLAEQQEAFYLPPLAENPFEDTRDPWVRRAFALELTSGISPTVFDCYSTLNREQAATMFVTLYEKLTGETLETQGAPNFEDHEEISFWARDKVYILASKGILTGVGDNYFAPQDSISGESALVMALATYHDLTNFAP